MRRSRSAARIAPGPSGSRLLGNLGAFRRDVLGLALEASRRYGDVVRFRLGPRVVHLVNHPEHVQYVLQRNQRNFVRSARSAKKIAAVCGDSLLTTSGAAWADERQLVQPAFHPQSVATFAPLMVDATAAMLERWEIAAREQRALDVTREMSRVTFTIVAKALFGADVLGDADRVAAAMDVLMQATFRRLSRVIDVPAWLPTPSNRRYAEALATLDAVGYRVMGDRRRAAAESHLLGTVLRHSAETAGAHLTDRQLRDLTITLLLAGHETTANALAWTLYLLSQHPDVERDLCSELERELSGRAPSIADLRRLPFAEMVLYESLRLYPPIWIIERRVIEDDEIGGFHIPAGSTVVVCPFALHRHPGFWPKPDDFVPSRFDDPDSPHKQRTAFMPFGAGPHTCIGSQFALIEARLVLAMVMQAYQLRLEPGQRVTPDPGITLRFAGGFRAHLTRRPAAVSQPAMARIPS